MRLSHPIPTIRIWFEASSSFRVFLPASAVGLERPQRRYHPRPKTSNQLESLRSTHLVNGACRGLGRLLCFSKNPTPQSKNHVGPKNSSRQTDLPCMGLFALTVL